MRICQGSWCVALVAGAVGFGAALMLGAGEPEKTKPGQPQPTTGQKQGAPAHGHPMPQMTEQQKREMEAWMAAGTPGPMHEKMAWFVGKWDAEVESNHDGMTDRSTGSMVTEPMWDGRFNKSKFNGAMMGMPFEGIAIAGYNNAAKRFETIWVDSMMTAMSFSTGTVDAAGKKFSFTSEGMCPVRNKMITCRTVETITGPDSYVMEFYHPNREDKEELAMTIRFKRAK